jgi:hypothetical protein
MIKNINWKLCFHLFTLLISIGMYRHTQWEQHKLTGTPLSGLCKLPGNSFWRAALAFFVVGTYINLWMELMTWVPTRTYRPKFRQSTHRIVIGGQYSSFSGNSWKYDRSQHQLCELKFHQKYIELSYNISDCRNRWIPGRGLEWERAEAKIGTECPGVLFWTIP